MSNEKNIKGKDLNVFVRFGGVNLKKQNGYTSKDGDVNYHAPPAARGIYAMPKIAQEFFLIGSMDKFQPGTMPKCPEYPGDVSDEELEAWRVKRDAFDWDAFHKRCSDNKSDMRKEFAKRDGHIWHHLGQYCSNSEIISRHGSWVKTSIKDWMKAFSKMSLELRYGTGEFANKSINDTRGVTGWYSKDHCEVFFDEKI